MDKYKLFPSLKRNNLFHRINYIIYFIYTIRNIFCHIIMNNTYYFEFKLYDFSQPLRLSSDFVKLTTLLNLYKKNNDITEYMDNICLKIILMTRIYVMKLGQVVENETDVEKYSNVCLSKLKFLRYTIRLILEFLSDYFSSVPNNNKISGILRYNLICDANNRNDIMKILLFSQLLIELGIDDTLLSSNISDMLSKVNISFKNGFGGYEICSLILRNSKNEMRYILNISKTDFTSLMNANILKIKGSSITQIKNIFERLYVYNKHNFNTLTLIRLM